MRMKYQNVYFENFHDDRNKWSVHGTPPGCRVGFIVKAGGCLRFDPVGTILFTAGALRDIADFIEEAEEGNGGG